jgi:TRAP-type C4-dicarboxylate transport system permease small subunit
MDPVPDAVTDHGMIKRPGRPVADRLCWGLSRVVLPALNGAMASVVFLQVVLRYLFNAPLSWTDELARIFVIWMVYLGLALTARRDSEVVMGGLIDVLPARVKAGLLVLRDVGVVVFVVVVLVSAVQLTLVDRAMTTAAMEISWAWSYAALAVGLAFYALETFPLIFRRLWQSRVAAAAWVIALGYLGMTFATPPVARTLTALTPLVLLVFFFIEMPVAFALGTACLYYLVLQGGVTALIIRFALALVGHIRGGLRHVSVVTASASGTGTSGREKSGSASSGQQWSWPRSWLCFRWPTSSPTSPVAPRCRRRSWTCCSRCPARRGWRS